MTPLEKFLHRVYRVKRALIEELQALFNDGLKTDIVALMAVRDTVTAGAKLRRHISPQ